MEINEGFEPVPFTQAIQFFRQKLELPTRAWTDVLRREHDRAFVVAGATKMDFLQDMKGAVQAAIEEGITIREFRRRFDEAVAKRGWPFPDRSDTDAYRAWRTRIIYQTNIMTANAAGRHAQMTDPDVLRSRPYWQYRHGGSPDPRVHHLNWDGLVLRASDPWWSAHYPPNGWGCSCFAVTLSGRDLERRGLEVQEAPEVETREWTNPNTGKVEQIPQGIDPGWNYTPGRSWVRSQAPAQVTDTWPMEAASGGVSFGGGPRSLPAPRRLSRDLLMDEGLDESEYLAAFMREFGAAPGDEVFFDDLAGETVIVSDELFRQADGTVKVLKRGRAPYVRVLARTIQEPDEIWVRLEQVGDRWRVARRYLARFEIGDTRVPLLVAFEWRTDVWRGLTAFAADSERYLESQRRGRRIYWRSDEALADEALASDDTN